MKSNVLASVVIAASVLPLSGMSCAPSFPAADLLAKQRRDNEALLAEITPADGPVGGSVMVLIPSDELLVPVSGNVRPKDPTFFIQSRKGNLLNMVEVLKRNRLFDSVQWRQSANPQQEQFQEDFALICMYVSDGAESRPEWSLGTRRQTQGELLPIESGPYVLSRVQRAAIWLNSIEVAAKKVKEQ